MRKLSILAATLGVIVLVLVAIVVLDIGSGRQLPEPPEHKGAPNSARLVRAVEPESVKESAPAPEPVQQVSAVPEIPGLSPEVVRVKPGRVLAIVNGQNIQLKDLIPMPAEKTGKEQVFASAMYEHLLKRAVEREIAFQAARAQGVELTETQRQQLAEARARSETKEQGVFDDLHYNPASVEFQERDFSALLLQATLAEKAGVPSAHVTPELVEAYYQQHQAEYGQLPVNPESRQSAWEKIDGEIRVKLAKQVRTDHEENFKQFVENLKAAAKVTVVSTAD